MRWRAGSASGGQAEGLLARLSRSSRGLWWWTPTAVVSLGLAAGAMLLATHQIGGRHVVHYAPLERAVADLQVAISNSHLWLEEHLTGDPAVDLERDVWGNLDHAESLARGLLLGGAVDSGRHHMEPLEEPELRAGVERIGHLLVPFRTLAGTRLAQSGDGGGVGSRLDQRYDQVYRQLLAETTRLERGVEERMMAGLRRSNLLFTLIMVVWVGIIGVAVATLRLRRRSQLQAEENLRRREEQMRQSQKLEAVGRLAGGLAHDVNNYLATINTQCGLVKILHPDQPGIASLMDEVISTVGRTSLLLQRLLSFSRDQPVTPVVVDLNRLADDLGSMMRRLLSDEVLLERRTVPDLWSVEADMTQLEQVLVNLLVNAREAMPGGGEVLLETANVSVDEEEVMEGGRYAGALPGAVAGEYVMLAVGDNGPGIAAELRDKIFEPFFSTKLAEGGRRNGHSGLGLATVYGIVQKHGGFLLVESEEGVGTTFRVFLPRTHRKPDPDAVPAERSFAPGRRRYRVLVVEDNPELRRAADAILTAVGHEVTTAEDGREGLRRIDEASLPYDFVITDLVMPGASGREIASRALASERTCVVVVSGFRDRISVGDLVVHRRVRYLDKPFNPEVLLRCLEELEGTRGEAPPEGGGDAEAGGERHGGPTAGAERLQPRS